MGTLPRRLLFLVIGTVLLPLLAGGHADSPLRKLDCVNPEAAVLESGSSLGTTIEVLREALRTQLQTKLPRLKVDRTCPNRLFLKVFLQNISTDQFDGFFGHVALELRRKATFTDTAQPVDARAWALESFVHGTRDKAKTSVLDQLTIHFAQFAAEYQAQNP
ncbi:hypothetical protein [Nitrospira sp. Kam-Ns4a]